jgi:Tol biopolymer transport system component/imidazolonepropionase-like amidohydrolase
MFGLLVVILAFQLAFSDDTSDEIDKWDVNNPPGNSKTVTIDVTEGTWMNVDVSPDGQNLVFDLLGDLYTVSIEGGIPTKLTSGMAWDMQPTYSPDGEWIAFTSDRGGGDNLWVIDVHGRNEKQISTETFRLLNSPAWSPDGKYLVGRKHFTSRRSLGAGELWLYHIDGGNGVQLTQKLTEQKDLGEPVFSDDGRYLYFSRDASGGKHFEYNKDPNKQIYVIERLNRQTGEIQFVTGGSGGAIRPTPSPDGKSLAFLKRKRADTVLMIRDLSSGEEREIIGGFDHDMQETWAIHGVYSQLSWMPDGEEIVYWAKGKLNRVHIENSQVTDIPFHIVDSREIRTAIRFDVDVSPETFDVKLIRGARTSPDGTMIAYQALGRIWIQTTTGGEPQRITTSDDVFEFDPSWSADSKSITYATWNDQEFGSIRIINLKRSKTEILGLEKGHYSQPIFSPDGKSIVYLKQGGGWLRSPLWSNDQGVYQYLIRDKESHLLTDRGSNPHFTENENFLYLNQWREGHLTLQEFDVTSRQFRQIAKTEKGIELKVSPDGDYLVYKEDHNVYVMRNPQTGKTISTGTKSLPAGRLSSYTGRDVEVVGSAVYWTVGDTREWLEIVDFLADTEVEPNSVKMGFVAKTDQHQEEYAIVGARIITMGNSGVIEQGTIIWKGNRIVAVGPTEQITVAKGIQVFSGEGLTIMPGLIDVHFHGSQGDGGIIPQQNWKNLSSLSFGVTTIHDPSNNTQMVFSASELQRTGEILAPRIYSTGTILYGAESRSMAKINNLDDALEHLQRMKSVGAISVKSYNQPRRDQRQQVIEAGRQTGVMVVPEGGSLMMHNLTQIVDGHTGVEHAIPVAPLYEDVLQLWSQTQVGYTPTLGVAYGGLMGEHYWYGNTNVWENERLLKFVPRSVIDAASRRGKRVPDEEYHHITIAKSASILFERGVSVQIGAHGQREGLAAHWEMWMLEQGGMKPLDVLKVATIQGAEYLGLDGDIGSLESNKLADFIVLQKNPLEDLSNSTSVQWTVLNGRVYESQSMDQLYPESKELAPLYFSQDNVLPTKTSSVNCGCTNH